MLRESRRDCFHTRMSDSQNTNPPAAAVRTPRTWDFMETTLVALIAYAVLVLTVDLSVDVILSMQDGVDKLTPAQFEQLAMQGRWHGAALVIACPATLAVLWIGTRRAGRQFSEYLALNWPNRNELLGAFAAMAVVLL